MHGRVSDDSHLKKERERERQISKYCSLKEPGIQTVSKMTVITTDVHQPTAVPNGLTQWYFQHREEAVKAAGN